MIDSVISGVLIFIIVGIVGVLSRHITNDEKHPSKKDIVFKDTCAAIHRGDTLKMESVERKLDEHKNDYVREFAEIKALIIKLNNKRN